MNATEKTTVLKTAVIKTIVFFDMFNYPLTCWDIWQNLSIETDLATLESVVISLTQENIISQKEGFYFLPGKEELIGTRRERVIIMLIIKLN